MNGTEYNQGLPDHLRSKADGRLGGNTGCLASITSGVDRDIEKKEVEAGEDDTAIRTAQLSKVVSVSHPTTVVPRSERRGLFARLTFLPEVFEPHKYKRRVKWLITLIVAVAAAAAPLGSTIILPALNDISRAFHTAASTTNLSVALYTLAMSIFPLWWSSFSETLGRRSIYVVSFALFTIFAVVCAVSVSLPMFITFRLLTGGAAASVQAIGAATIADIWEPKERGRAMGIFYLGPLCGPFLGPIMGGFMTEGLGWRSTQWSLVIYGALMTLSLILFLPETIPYPKDTEEKAPEAELLEKATPSHSFGAPMDRTVTVQSVKQQTWTAMKFLHRIFVEPLEIILYIRYPAIASTIYYASITFGSLYFLNISIEQTFSHPPYAFSTTIVGLMYIPNSIGYISASLFTGRWIDHIMAREAKKADRVDADGKLIYRPEDRMRENAWLGAILFPGALIWYGWTAEKSVFWLVPMIANFFFGIGSMIIFTTTITMLTEFMPNKASCGIALNNFVRNIFSCVGAIVAVPLIRAIGNGWICTILGLVSLSTGSAVIWSMKRYGSKWSSDMARRLS